jgi:DNA (cytosine-5)-methyltransferase 1
MEPIKFGSVCSGIEAASVAWHPLGWQTAWLAEIEPFPSAVLAHHYPNTPNLGDMTTIARRILTGEVEAPDVFAGGTPCQAFSVAGLRKSLDDARGNLSLKFVELADAIDHVRARRGAPECVVFWENVPGVLSTPDNAFGCFLAGLAGEDEPLVPPGKRWGNAGCVYGPRRAVAWRTLDAQYFGVAQRRRRVFVVASARDGFDPAQVLFEWEGVRRDSAPSRGARPDSAVGTLGGTSPGGGWRFGADEAAAGQLIAGTLGQRTCDHTSGLKSEADFVVPVGVDGWNGRLTGDIAATLGTRGSSETAAGPTLLQPLPFDTTQITSAENRCRPEAGDPCHPLAAGAHPPAVAFNATDYEAGAFEQCDRAGPLTTSADRSRAAPLVATAQVRRLMPEECEPLQGFPRGYTLIPWRGRPASECPDGPRYKALGNSWAVPVAHWAGKRIDAHLKRLAA